MNKRALRKYINPKTRFNLNNGLFCAEEIKYLVCTSVKNISGRRILILYFYLKDNILAGDLLPIWIVFQSANEYITYCNSGKTRWRTCRFCDLERDYYFINHCAFYSIADEKRVTKFCKITDEKGFDSLYRFQLNLFYKKERQNKIKKQQQIAQKMKSVVSLPRDLKNFILREAVPYYIFYDYHRSKKPYKGYCTACKHEVGVTGIKHNSTGICPHCKKTVTYKCRGRRGNIIDRTTVQVIQRTNNNELVIRIIKAYCQYNKTDTPNLDVYENARCFISWNNTDIEKIQPYYYSYGLYEITNWHKGNRPVANRWYYNFEADTCGYLYHKNLDEIFEDTPWKYSALKEYYFGDPTPLCVVSYLKKYLQYPMLEYLVKLRLFRLATFTVYGEEGSYLYGDNYLNRNGKNVSEILGVHKQYLPLLQEIDPGAKQLLIIKEMINMNIKPNKDLLKWCTEYSIGNKDSVLYPLNFMTPYKLMRYATKYLSEHRKASYYSDGEYSNMSDLLSDYKDYLEMSNALNYDMKNSFVLYPKSLKEAHNTVNDITEVETSEAYDRKIANDFDRLQNRYQFEKNGLTVLAPHSSSEIIAEGQALHHCVGGYVKNVVREKSTILFIRETDTLDKPYCTVEIKDGNVAQARICNNNTPPPNVEKFIDEWKRDVVYATANAA